MAHTLPAPAGPPLAGKPANKYGYDDKCLNKEFAVGVIHETHDFYNKLRSGARENTEELSLF